MHLYFRLSKLKKINFFQTFVREKKISLINCTSSDIARAIVTAAKAENKLQISSSSSEGSMSVAEPPKAEVAKRGPHRPIDDFRVGLSHGLTSILDQSGEAVEDKEVIDSFFQGAYGDEELVSYAERIREREALIRKLIREWRTVSLAHSPYKLVHQLSLTRAVIFFQHSRLMKTTRD